MHPFNPPPKVSHLHVHQYTFELKLGIKSMNKRDAIKQQVENELLTEIDVQCNDYFGDEHTVEAVYSNDGLNVYVDLCTTNTNSHENLIKKYLCTVINKRNVKKIFYEYYKTGTRAANRNFPMSQDEVDEIKKASSEGKTVEFLNVYNEWVNLKGSFLERCSWNPDYRYRIKV